MFRARAPDDRAGQRRQIDDEFRLELALRVGERIGQHQPAFGVGVQHFDGLARHRFHHIVRALRLAVRHVLDQADHADGVDLRLARGQRQHRADDGGGAAHVALHAHHAGAGLERQAAGIETHALADEGDRRVLLLARAVPLHDDELAFALAALPHAQQRAHAELLHLGFAQHLDLHAELGEQRLGAAGEFLRMTEHSAAR